MGRSDAWSWSAVFCTSMGAEPGPSQSIDSGGRGVRNARRAEPTGTLEEEKAIVFYRSALFFFSVPLIGIVPLIDSTRKRGCLARGRDEVGRPGRTTAPAAATAATPP